MKKIWWGFVAFFLVVLIGCDSGYSASGNSSSNSSNSGSVAPKSNSSDIDVINIPSIKQPAPNGILDQLAWGAVGGPGGLGTCENCNVEISGSTLTMSGFESHQELKVLLYRRTSGPIECAEGTADYLTSMEIQVDEQGYKEIDISGAYQDILIFAFDTATDEHLFRSVPYVNILSGCSTTSSGSCTGAPPQRLQVNEMAYVCTKSETVKLREGPGKKYSVLKSLVSGADVKIIGGPKCADNWSWWEVETESGYRGWMSEGGDNVDKYFLCPGK